MARTIAPVPSQVVGSLRPVRYQLTLSRIVRCWSGEKPAASVAATSVTVIVADRTSRVSWCSLTVASGGEGSASDEPQAARGESEADDEPAINTVSWAR